jgi:hypothetical protein
MHAAHLKSLLQGAVALALPAAAFCATAPSLPGCCGPAITHDVRAIVALPPGWAQTDKYLEDPKTDTYYQPYKDGPELEADACAVLCGEAVDHCELVFSDLPAADAGTGGAGGMSSSPESAEGEILILCDVYHPQGCGRRPPCFVRRRRTRITTAIGTYFAEITHLEAASVEAFAILRRELAAHGALARDVAREPPEELTRIAGVPGARAAERLAASIAERLPLADA